jgi:hypothetical protein
MTRDFFDPPWEETDVVAIDRKTIETAMRQVLGCEACSPDAQIPFDWILDRVTGRSGATTDYVLEVPGICRQCGGEIREKTLVEFDDDHVC